jgi:hypothetical protein
MWNGSNPSWWRLINTIFFRKCGEISGSLSACQTASRCVNISYAHIHTIIQSVLQAFISDIRHKCEFVSRVSNP